MEIYRFVLCEARHLHPEINNLPAIYPTIVNPMDFAGLYVHACNVLTKTIDRDVDAFLNIYVTGITSALIEVLNVARNLYRIKHIVVWHYDRDADEYIPQSVCK